MAYGTYKTLDEILTKFNVEKKNLEFAKKVNIKIPVTLLNYIKENLKLDRNYFSENSICEMIIAPILSIVAKKYDLPIWSHPKLDVSAEDGLTGIPDFLIAPVSKTGVSFTNPIVCIAEVKRENFEEGWTQALCEMIAAQRLNNNPQKTIYGIATSGKFWQFGKLIDKQLIVDPIPYSAPLNLQQVLNVLNWFLGEAKKEL